MDGTSRWRPAYARATSNGVPRRCFAVALVVGTVLNAINQGDQILDGGAPNWFKLILTYLVPYAVCTYGAMAATAPRRGGPRR